MPQELIDKLVSLGISLGISFVLLLIALIVAKIRAKLSDKELTVFDEIAKTVETVYLGMSASDKLEAFKELCKAKKVNVNRGVAYLEQHIIPTSKVVNIISNTSNDGENDVTD